jgi:hypothetical protein
LTHVEHHTKGRALYGSKVTQAIGRNHRAKTAAALLQVLPYASDFDDLRAFFRSANRHLVAGEISSGGFSSVQ